MRKKTKRSISWLLDWLLEILIRSICYLGNNCYGSNNRFSPYIPCWCAHPSSHGSSLRCQLLRRDMRTYCRATVRWAIACASWEHETCSPRSAPTPRRTVHLHACSTMVSSHSLSVCPLTAPMLTVLLSAGLLAGRGPEEVQLLLMRLHGRRLQRCLRTRPSAGLRARVHHLPLEHAAGHPHAVVC